MRAPRTTLEVFTASRELRVEQGARHKSSLGLLCQNPQIIIIYTGAWVGFGRSPRSGKTLLVAEFRIRCRSGVESSVLASVSVRRIMLWVRPSRGGSTIMSSRGRRTWTSFPPARKGDLDRRLPTDRPSSDDAMTRHLFSQADRTLPSKVRRTRAITGGGRGSGQALTIGLSSPSPLGLAGLHARGTTFSFWKITYKRSTFPFFLADRHLIPSHGTRCDSRRILMELRSSGVKNLRPHEQGWVQAPTG